MRELRARGPHFSSFSLLLLTLATVASPSAHHVAALQQPIKTLVVLVLENRSFDHMLGWMKTINPKINGVTGKECNPISTRAPDASSICFTHDAKYVEPDPGHSFEEVKQQVFGSNNSTPTMSGFVEQARSLSKNVSETVMRGFSPRSLPVFSKLVEEFAVFDRWFSSIPGPTQPNRLFVYSATSHGAIEHDELKFAKGFPQETIFDAVHKSGKNFAIYYEDIPSTFLYRNLRKVKYISKFHHYNSKFKEDARNGNLPSLTVIEPRYFDLLKKHANDDHPSHDVANGQRLVKEVYETLRSSPQWNEILLLITYDEHGGFYDHVLTPSTNIPNPDGSKSSSPSSFNFDRLGVRVPTIMVSPWIRKATVISKAEGPNNNSEYEHSSIPATIKKLFNLSTNFLTHRDAWAGTFENVLELTSPRTDCPVTLPNVASLREAAPNEEKVVSQFQSELVELAAALNGDHSRSSFRSGVGAKMNVKEAQNYVHSAASGFIRASKEALKLGASEDAIVNMRSSLTSRSPGRD